MAEVLALVDDLFFQAKMMETARRVGVALQTVSSGPALVTAAAAQEHKLVLVDLNARQGALEAVALEQRHGLGAQPQLLKISHRISPLKTCAPSVAAQPCAGPASGAHGDTVARAHG